MINVALPKGRLGEKVYRIFDKLGYSCPELQEDSRKLIFESRENGVRYFWVKPSDVAIYVERGAADVGIAGKDILLEYEPDVYELLDLGIGKCRMAVAGKRGFRDDRGRTLRVATKFPRIAFPWWRNFSFLFNIFPEASFSLKIQKIQKILARTSNVFTRISVLA